MKLTDRLLILFVVIALLAVSGCGSDDDTTDDDSPDGESVDGDLDDTDSPDNESVDADLNDGDESEIEKTEDLSLDGDEKPDGDLFLEDGDEDISEIESVDEEVSAVWSDPSTGYIWANVIDYFSSDEGDSFDCCQNLILGGYDDWRLPTISELRTLIDGCPNTETEGDCEVTDDCSSQETCRDVDMCKGCDSMNGPTNGCYFESFLNGPCDKYPSSTDAGYEGWCTWGCVWGVNFTEGAIVLLSSDSYEGAPVRCVRM